MHNPRFFLYLLVMAGVTYLVRMLPLVLVKKKIRNRFLMSFLHYIPYAVLSAMTIPACFTPPAALSPPSLVSRSLCCWPIADADCFSSPPVQAPPCS